MLFALMALSFQADALTAFDISGVGWVCTYDSNGACINQDDITFTGVITIDVNPAGPSGADYVTDGSRYAQDLDGWVTSTFQLFWSGGAYASAPVVGETHRDNVAYVSNDDGVTGVQFDSLLTSFNSYRIDDVSQQQSYASFRRYTQELNWLSSLAFPESIGLAPSGNSSYNTIEFGDYLDPLIAGGRISGVRGQVSLSSMVARASVPEPGTLALLGLGLAGLGLGRRRKPA